MNEEIKIILSDYKQKFKDYFDYLEKNNWSVEGDTDGYDLENTIVSDILINVASFKKEVGDNIYDKKTQDFFKTVMTIVNTHIERTSHYLEEFKWSERYDKDIRRTKDQIAELGEYTLMTKKEKEFYKELNSNLDILREATKREMVQQSEMFTKTNKIKVNILNLNIDIDNEMGATKSIKLFHTDKKATLYLREFLEEHVPILKRKTEQLGIDFSAPHVNPSTSNEMLINMNPKDIPPYEPEKHFFEQPKSTIEFWEEERRKNINGINIGGYFIHPWLYYHLNSFKVANAEGTHSKPMHPDFRDNEYFLAEMLKIAEEDGRKGIMMYGSRRWGKSATMSSYLAHKLHTILNAKCTAIAFSKIPDLDNLIEYLNLALTNSHPGLSINANNLDYDEGVKLGLKLNPQVRLDYSSLIFTNLEAGTKKSATQKTAAFTPNGFIFDEIAKGACIKPWMAATPSFVKKDGKWRLVPLLSGCVCAGTKVYTHDGDLINIEDLKQDDGIIGFDKEKFETSKEPITWMQPPSEKPCYRITTKKGLELECSYEHPILVRHRNKKEKIDGEHRRKIEFIPTEELEVGQHIVVNESFDVWGDKKMWEPRLVGWLIGDGSYGYNETPRLFSCDNEINEYVISNFEISKSRKDRLTKDGKKVYIENRIKGITKELRNLDIYGQVKCNKTLPTKIHKYSKIDVCEMLGGLFDTDGHVSNTGENKSISFTSGCKNLIDEVRDILNKIGIHPTICKKISKPTKLIKKESTYYVLTISDKRSVLCFYKNIHFKIKYKQDLLEKVIKRFENHKEKIPKELKNIRLDIISNIEYIGMKPIYNLTAGKTNTYIANHIVTHNTAGESTVSKDAEKMLKNPENYHLLPMNYDLLEKHIDPEWVTWNRDEKFAFFMPAQMSLEAGSKIKKTFADFLGLPESNPLEKIRIEVTDWENAGRLFKERREALKSDLDLLAAESNSFPITPTDCYLTTEKNKFPGLKAKHRKEFVENEGIDGNKVWLKKNPHTGDIYVELTDDPVITEYPYSGGNFEAPIVLLDLLDEGEIPPLGLYVIGFDDVKHDSSDGDSVISATIFKRSYMGGEWANRIVGWYDSRPEKKEYYKNLFLVMKYLNARVLAENEDNGFLEYLEDLDMRNGTNHVLTHISEGVGLASEDNLHKNKNRKFGWAPTSNNIYHLENKIVMYTKEDGIVIGEVQDLEGIDRINHPMLLEELYKYKKGNNADRIRSFGLALTLAQYYDKTYQYMTIPKEKREDRRKDNKKRGISITKNGFTDTSRLRKF